MTTINIKFGSTCEEGAKILEAALDDPNTTYPVKVDCIPWRSPTVLSDRRALRQYTNGWWDGIEKEEREAKG
jgi:hypothetical protein